MTFHRFLVDGVEALAIATSVVGIIRYKKLSTEFRFVFYFVLLGAVTELFTDFYKAHFFRNTMPIGHVYIPASILIIALMYRSLLKGFLNRSIYYSILAVLVVFSLFNPLFLQSIWEFPNITGAFGALIVIIFSVLFFYKIMVEARTERLFSEPLVWINTMVLVYFTGNFFFYVLFNLNVADSLTFAGLTVRFFGIMNLILYFVFGYFILTFNQQKTSI